MGIFKGKQQDDKPTDDVAVAVNLLFDDEYREDLKNRGRIHFERVINENAALFKQDLDATVAHINTELKQHVARQLDDQFAEIAKTSTELREHVTKQFDVQFVEFSKTIKDAQELALHALEKSAQALEQQHQQLASSLEKSVAQQDAAITSAFNDNKAQLAAMKDTHDAALQTLVHSTQALQEQHKQLNALLQKGIVDQQNMLVEAFEQNMAQVVEHYLLEALGDEYDLKAQVPAIIKQMETNKQAIADDMKL